MTCPVCPDKGGVGLRVYGCKEEASGFLAFIKLTSRKYLSGILAKSRPLHFATKNSFPLFFVCEKGLVHMYQNHFIYFQILYFCFATSQKPILPATGFPAVIERLKFMDFERRVRAN